MKELSDKELVGMAQNELPYSTSSFEILINRHQDKIFNVCKSILKDYHLAEDATQNTMLRVFHYIKNFKNDSSFFTWVYRIAYNESLQIINKNKRVEILDEGFSEINIIDNNLDKEIEVEEILKDLNSEEKEILYLKYALEFKDEEIASIMEIELSACKMRLKRLKDKIKFR